MAKGTVKWFSATKGFGFIAPDDGSKEVLVHLSAVHHARALTLEDGTLVEYELVEGRDGRTSAANLRIIGVPAVADLLALPAERPPVMPGAYAAPNRDRADPAQ